MNLAREVLSDGMRRDRTPKSDNAASARHSDNNGGDIKNRESKVVCDGAAELRGAEAMVHKKKASRRV